MHVSFETPSKCGHFETPPPPQKKMWWFQSKRDLLCRVRSSRFADRVLFRFVFQSRRGWRRRLPRWQKCKKEKRRRSRMRRRRRRRRRRGNDEKTRRKTRSHDHDRHPSGNQTPALFYLVVDATSSDFRITAGITTDRSLLTNFFEKKTNKTTKTIETKKNRLLHFLFLRTRRFIWSILLHYAKTGNVACSAGIEGMICKWGGPKHANEMAPIVLAGGACLGKKKKIAGGGGGGKRENSIKNCHQS